MATHARGEDRLLAGKALTAADDHSLAAADCGYFYHRIVVTHARGEKLLLDHFQEKFSLQLTTTAWPQQLVATIIIG